MRLQTTITELSTEQWELAQKVLKTGYEIPADASRVCLTLEHNGEERHAEMPLGAYIGLLGAFGLTSLATGLQTAMAALTPDALPDHLDDLRNAADPQRAAERRDGPPLAEVHDPATGRYTVDPDRA